jgi:hypothetical protein
VTARHSRSAATAPILPQAAVDQASFRAQMREVAQQVRASFTRHIGDPETA